MERLAGILVEHAFQQRQGKGATERRCGRDEVAGLRGEPVESRENRLLHGRRHLHLDGVVEAPAVLGSDEGTNVCERPDELLEEERIPVGSLEHTTLELSRQCRRRDERG